MNPELYTRSVNIILQNQSPWGSYIASPAFPTYHYCWLRDGSFTAHAMDVAGEYASAEAFFRWVGATIQKHAGKIKDIRQKVAAGLPLGKDETLHTRFSLDGQEVFVDASWGNFQIDGYGAWLWALAEHARRSGNAALVRELAEPVAVTVQYLALVWQQPNYDCWEEFPQYLHLYSLATVYAGLRAVAALVEAGYLDPSAVDVAALAEEVKAFIGKFGVSDGRLVKSIQPGQNGAAPKPVWNDRVDASLLGVFLPYGVFDPHGALAQATLQAIERDLHRPQGGVYRYCADVYYGGGEWLLLAGWLGWYYASVGQLAKAEELRAWIESQADENGDLAEQVNDHVLSPQDYAPWVQKWGPVAKPLLWSHAMYIILTKAIEEGKPA